MPAALPPSRWAFPSPRDAEHEGPAAIGGDLEASTLVAAYAQGLFPMPLPRRTLGWFSPDPRAVLEPAGMHISRSLGRSRSKMTVTIDSCFAEVVRGCADPARAHGWIDDNFFAAYYELHTLGWAHSIEAWLGDRLAGGLYGVAIGAFFAGESMFHAETDGSKVALAGLCEHLRGVDAVLFDVQWATPHLESLGVTEITRDEYLDRLDLAVRSPGPTWQAGPTGTEEVPQ